MHSIGNSLVTFVRGRSIGCAGAGFLCSSHSLPSLPWAGTHSDSSRDREPVASCSSRSSLAIQVQVYDESHGFLSHVLAIRLSHELRSHVLVALSAPPSLGQVAVPKCRSVRAGRRGAAVVSKHVAAQSSKTKDPLCIRRHT